MKQPPKQTEKALEDESVLAFDDIYDEYLLYCATLAADKTEQKISLVCVVY